MADLTWATKEIDTELLEKWSLWTSTSLGLVRKLEEYLTSDFFSNAQLGRMKHYAQALQNHVDCLAHEQTQANNLREQRKRVTARDVTPL